MKDDEIKDLGIEQVDQNEQEEEVLEYDPSDEEGNTDGVVKKLKAKIKDLETTKTEYLNGWQRAQADFVNYKKDENERIGRIKEISEERLITDLLPALDSYDMAFANKDAWEKVDANWRVGIEYIHSQILKVLEDYGVVSISAKVGDKFDPNIHQPIDKIETEDKDKDETISSIVQTGYKIKDKVLRPARVNIFGLK